MEDNEKQADAAAEPTDEQPAEGADAPATDAPPTDTAASDADTSAPADDAGDSEVVEELVPIAPGVPRLGVPVGAGRAIPAEGSPNYLFLTIVSVLTLGLDIASKNWAVEALEAYPGTISLWDNHAAFILARNRGGAWGFFQGASEAVRKPFFLLVSAAAIVFIVTLFRRLQPKQHALRWGLPLVMGGALGNVFDRIRFGSVVDFIDFHVNYKGVEHHWPTFNVADIAICVGVGLMAVDMFTSKRGKAVEPAPAAPAPASDVSLEKSEAAEEKEAVEGS